MKKVAIFLSLLALFRVLGVLDASAQEKFSITVKASELNSGVVILQIAKAGTDYQLQCNQGAPGCVSLKSGKYQMVELPKGFGMYECRDVEVYPEPNAGSSPAPDKDARLGECRPTKSNFLLEAEFV